MVPITEAEILARYPGIEQELGRVRSWFLEPLDFVLSEYAMSRYSARAARAISIYPRFPDNQRRMQAIIDAIERGEPAWPLFLYAEDDFLLEGWHRISALHMLKFKTTNVVLVSRRSMNDPAAKDFKLSEIKVVQNEWKIGIEWRGVMVGMARLNSKPMAHDQNARHLDNSFVLPKFRRKGIAKIMYDELDGLLTKQGLYLAPSPEPILSDEAFSVWQRRAPHLLINDSRLRRDAA